MDIQTQVEITLREGGYETWLYRGLPHPVIGFEDPTVVGFVHIFPSEEALVENWRASQLSVLNRHAAALRAAGTKSWNVYSVFLAPGVRTSRQAARIEEDFTMTRKIARASIRTSEDVVRALLPLMAVRSKPRLLDADFEGRMKARLKDVSPATLNALFSDASPDDVALMLGEGA